MTTTPGRTLSPLTLQLRCLARLFGAPLYPLPRPPRGSR
ncbi:hypothetical protein SAMN05444351_2033 [Geodermatophilus nigrescens]|uniref:Uncharacterized protein n=1 Tax=Geodermatophilus nigrescens TaxID=1070870 RepID=A0A1M5IEU0_9ACTN|nr:hypothetical protein SAMN05444351_2033 [Geodermatophilus nigrescens]